VLDTCERVSAHPRAPTRAMGGTSERRRPRRHSAARANRLSDRHSAWLGHEAARLLAVLQTDNASRVRDGYISLGTFLPHGVCSSVVQVFELHLLRLVHGCDSQAMQHRPEWWELGHAEDGSLAGVIMAARNPSTAVIAYVGVVPSRRRRGLARHLVQRGTERLLESGAVEIRGDCDRDNVGMVKAFERAGYARFARRRTYHLALSRRAL
jgi:ribosomal protein S18 acetylase RimI-like enzyme